MSRRVPASPLELKQPAGFDPEDERTWPKVEGRLELVSGRLLYRPPTGDLQSDTTSDVATTLGVWRKAHPTFTVGTADAGVRLDGESRGVDAAVWRSADVGPYKGRFRRVPPVLAVEVQGEDDDATLRDKAAWYLRKGVAVVWLLFPEDTRALVLTSAGERLVERGQRMPEHPELPDLAPLVDELFEQVLARRS